MVNSVCFLVVIHTIPVLRLGLYGVVIRCMESSQVGFASFMVMIFCAATEIVFLCQSEMSVKGI